MKLVVCSTKGVYNAVGKGEICSLRAISPYSTMFSKELYGIRVKTRACWERVNPLPYYEILNLY